MIFIIAENDLQHPDDNGRISQIINTFPGRMITIFEQFPSKTVHEFYG